MKNNTVQQKKNFLTKSLLDQTKELCYKNSAVYKDFDSIFAKIETRLQNWELFEDEEILNAGQSLKIMANSGMIVNLVQDKNFHKLLEFFND